jgi:bifunctional non-homologous end joining protein LigD
MHRSRFEPCIPSPGTQVPDSKNWIHEIKHDGYRLIVQREGQRVRLLTRNRHDWSGRYPLITEAALRNRNSSFVIDGEAVLLGVHGVSDFDGLHRASTTMKCSSTPSTCWSATAMICGNCRSPCARPIWRGC